VGARIVLRPAHGLDVVVEVLGAFREIRQVAIGQLELGTLGVTPRELDEVGANGVADAAAARMQHDPGAIVFVQAELDEMVAAAESAELVDPARPLADALADAGMALHDPRQALLEALRRLDARIAIV